MQLDNNGRAQVRGWCTHRRLLLWSIMSCSSAACVSGSLWDVVGRTATTTTAVWVGGFGGGGQLLVAQCLHHGDEPAMAAVHMQGCVDL